MAETSLRGTQVFLDALDLPESARADFVTRACANDSVLAARIMAMLRADAEPAAMLDNPIDALVGELFDADEIPPEPEPDARYGAWQPLHKLGEGGMGEVWLGQRIDGQFEQRVALKLIKLGMDSAQVQTQFRRERAMLARLQHPNVAQLIDGGIDSRGRPWFAMELVEGSSLREWLLQAAPGLRARLALFIKLCAAVAHAHQHLIVHRDLKPSNVMVQADGEPKLLDFGIAKLVDNEDTQRTVTVQRFLSRDYAAPEQTRGEAVSTATDVYALGLILFELLTGDRYRKVHHNDEVTLRPSSAVHGSDAPLAVSREHLRGDLDAITAHALANEPGQRYASAQALAEDVQRYLDGLPINARPEKFAYRASKFVRRNRAAVAASALGILGLMAASGVAFWQAHAKGVQAQRAEMALQRSEATRGFIESVFLSADPMRSQGENTTAGELLKVARGRVDSELRKQPEIAATLLDQIGNVYVSLGKDALARAALRDALRMNARSAQPSLAVEASAAGRLAHYDYIDGHADAALAEFDRIIALLKPHAQGLEVALSKLLQMKSNVLFSRGKIEASLRAVNAAVAVLAPYAATYPSEYAVALLAYADAAAGAGHGDAALAAAERALDLPLIRDAKAPALVLIALGAKVRALQSLHRDAQALPTVQAVIDGNSQQFGANSARTRYWIYRQAQMLQSLHRLDQAQAAIDKLLATPATDAEQPIAHVAHTVVAADIASARQSSAAPRLIAQAQTLACGQAGNANFCSKAKQLALAHASANHDTAAKALD